MVRRCVFQTIGQAALSSILLVLALHAGPQSALARPSATPLLPELHDLEAVAREVRESGLPLLLAFSSSHCRYCVVVEESFLIPMQRSGDYHDKVIMRRIHIDGSGSLRDRDGAPTTARSLMQGYGVKVTPTLVFLDADGNRLTDDLVGISNEYFYGGQLDDAINQALGAIKPKF
ncbi:MAG: thioredoxin family protein [Thiotrichales bacterium]